MARAGPERVEGTTRTGPVALELGFAADDFGYLVDLGLPQMAGHGSLFALDPEIKREVVFAGAVMRTGSTLVRRTRDYVEVSCGIRPRLRRAVPRRCLPYRSVLAEYAHPGAHPELAAVRDRLRDWRFYDGFRVDATRRRDSPRSVPGRRCCPTTAAIWPPRSRRSSRPDSTTSQRAVADAFDGATVSVAVHDGLFDLQLHQRGMLRPLRAAELSDGTLRFLLWAAALLSPQPPSLMVLNEPETSLHPDLVRPLASLIRAAANQTQVVVVTHSRAMLEFLGTVPVADAEADSPALEVPLYKDLGETRIEGLGLLTTPPWDWGKR